MNRILKYNDKLVEEVGSVTREKVVFLRYLRDKDMPKCECGRPINKDFDIVEGCLNWQSGIRGVETLK